MGISYAVFFKTHFWDEFNERQFKRLQARVKSGDIFIVIDETFGPAPKIDYDKIIGVTSTDFATNGLPGITTHGSIIWFNNDYANHVAYVKAPKYDYYIAIEYDAVVNTELDGLIDRIASDKVDFLGLPLRKPAAAWPWYPLLIETYGPDMLVYLSCFAVFSARAMAKLLTRRQEMGRDFADGKLEFWPNVEAFLPTEIRNAGMKTAALQQYGTAENFDWWPPLEEAELPAKMAQTFIHPVLSGTRYIRSLIHHEPSVKNFFRADSDLNRKLQKYDKKLVRSIIWATVRRRAAGPVQRLLERVGLRPKWYAKARRGSATGVQQKSVHNEN